MRRRSSAGSVPRVSTPSTRIRPLSGSRRRLIMRRVVVLPQPDGPMRTHVSPSLISSDRSRTALDPLANCLLTFSSRITAVYGIGMAARLFLDEVDPWINWGWVSSHVPYIWDAVQQHIVLTVIALAAGLVISLPLGVAAHRSILRLPVVGFFGAFYTIPSLALFAVLVPFTGIATTTTAEIPLIGYNVL